MYSSEDSSETLRNSLSASCVLVAPSDHRQRPEIAQTRHRVRGWIKNPVQKRAHKRGAAFVPPQRSWSSRCAMAPRTNCFLLASSSTGPGRSRGQIGLLNSCRRNLFENRPLPRSTLAYWCITPLASTSHHINDPSGPVCKLTSATMVVKVYEFLSVMGDKARAFCAREYHVDAPAKTLFKKIFRDIVPANCRPVYEQT